MDLISSLCVHIIQAQARTSFITRKEGVCIGQRNETVNKTAVKIHHGLFGLNDKELRIKNIKRDTKNTLAF